MWRKILKLREVTKSFYKKAVGNDRHTSFWYDRWSDRGVILDLLGDIVIIDNGIRRATTVEKAVLRVQRRIMYRTAVLNDIEADLTALQGKIGNTIENTSLCET